MLLSTSQPSDFQSCPRLGVGGENEECFPFALPAWLWARHLATTASVAAHYSMMTGSKVDFYFPTRNQINKLDTHQNNPFTNIFHTPNIYINPTEEQQSCKSKSCRDAGVRALGCRWGFGFVDARVCSAESSEALGVSASVSDSGGYVSQPSAAAQTHTQTSSRQSSPTEHTGKTVKSDWSKQAEVDLKWERESDGEKWGEEDEKRETDRLIWRWKDRKRGQCVKRKKTVVEGEKNCAQHQPPPLYSISLFLSLSNQY